MNLQELLREAAEAKPQSAIRGRWTQTYGVFETLRQQGFSVVAAIDWLVVRGAVPSGQRRKAQNAYMQIAVRRRKAEAAKADNVGIEKKIQE